MNIIIRGTGHNVLHYIQTLRDQGIPMSIYLKHNWRCSRGGIAIHEERVEAFKRLPNYAATKKALIRERDVALAKLLATNVEFRESLSQTKKRSISS